MPTQHMGQQNASAAVLQQNVQQFQYRGTSDMLFTAEWPHSFHHLYEYIGMRSSIILLVLQNLVMQLHKLEQSGSKVGSCMVGGH